MGIKTYLSTDDVATANSRPTKWIRIAGTTLYPHIDSLGNLTFSETNPGNIGTINIRGPKGPEGPKGDTPKISFKNAEGKPIPLVCISEEDGYVYDASSLSGPQGIQGPQGPQGIPGPTGKTPELKFDSIISDDDKTSIVKTNLTGGMYDAEYLIKIPKGKNGLSIVNATLDHKGNTILHREDGLQIPLGNLKGEQGIQGIQGIQGDPGQPGPALKFSDLTELEKASLKGEKGDSGTSFQLKGRYPSLEALKAVHATGNPGDAYAIGSSDSNEIYIWAVDGNTWENLGSLQGPKGDPGASIQGPPGTDATIEIGTISIATSDEDASVTNVGTPTKAKFNFKLPRGQQGPQGPQGPDGSIWHTGTEVTQSGNNSVSEAAYKTGDYYLNTDTGEYFKIHSYKDGVLNVSTPKSLKGPRGKSIKTISAVTLNSNQNATVVQTESGEDINVELGIPKGEKGDPGKGIESISDPPIAQANQKTKTYTINYTDGSSKQINIKDGEDGLHGTNIITGEGAPHSSIGSVNDLYIDSLNCLIYKKISDTVWGGRIDNDGNNVALASFKAIDGKPGEDGVRGPSFTVRDSNIAPTDTSDCIEGDGMLLNNYNIYVVQGAGNNKEWKPLGDGNIKGPKGDQGPQGPQGPAGSYIKANFLEDARQAIDITLLQSTYYHFTHSNITAINIALGPVESGTVGEFTLEFTINKGNNVPTITTSSDITYMNGWSTSCFQAGYTYILYILNNKCYVSRTEV